MWKSSALSGHELKAQTLTMLSKKKSNFKNFVSFHNTNNVGYISAWIYVDKGKKSLKSLSTMQSKSNWIIISWHYEGQTGQEPTLYIDSC